MNAHRQRREIFDNASRDRAEAAEYANGGGYYYRAH